MFWIVMDGWHITNIGRDIGYCGRAGMTVNAFAAFAAGIVVGAAVVGVIGKIYADNLHHIACKMYNTVDDQYRFDYVNKQFGCRRENS
jgi:hypothetical protein